MFREFTLILLAITIAIVGCDEGQKMMEPMMPPVVTDPVTELPAEPAPEDISINFNPNPPAPPDTSNLADLDILKSDRELTYEDNVFLERNADAFFNDAKTAIQSDLMTEFFESSEQWIAQFCRKNVRAEPDQIELYFATRQARKDFLNTLPGGYFAWYHLTLDMPDDLWEEAANTPVPEDADAHLSDSWWWVSAWVVIVSDKAYYAVGIYVNDQHKDCQ